MSQQPPYNNNQPQPYYPPGYTPAFPQPPQKKKRMGLRDRWKSGTGGKCSILFACGILLLGFFACSGVINAVNGTGSPIATPQVAEQVTPTDTPTDVPVPTAKPAPTVKPTPVPKVVPTATPQPAAPAPAPVPSGVNGNPWGYNFVAGNYIYAPAAGFCDYFTCVSTFWTKTSGYVAQCYNGSYTHSGGVSGACSRDGGIEQPLYSH